MIKSLFKKILFYGIGPLAILGIFSCAEEENRENFIAIVEDHKITPEDFRLFYEFDPNFGIDSTGMDALKDQLDLYIDRFLAGMKAEEDDLWEDPIFIRAYKWERRQALLRQLYREVVEEKVVITDEETLQEFMDLSVEVTIRHLFTRTEARAEELYRQLKSGESFEYLASQVFQDTVLAKNGGNLGWLRLADFDENLSNAIKKLPVGQVSKPVSSKWGYHIIEVLNRREEKIIVEEDYIKLKPQLYKRIKNRKTRKLSNEFITNYVGELNPQLDKDSFRYLLFVIVPSTELEKKEYSYKILLTDGLITAAYEELDEHVDKVLISYQGGTVTIRQFLDAMQDIPMGHRPEFKSVRQLSNQIGIWQRDNLLLEKAIALNLDENEQVIKEINEFKAEHSYYYYHNQIRDNSRIPFFVVNYFQLSSEARAKAQHHPLARFHNLEDWRWWKAQQDLHQLLREDNPTIWINQTLLEQENTDIDWNHQIRMFMVRKPS